MDTVMFVTWADVEKQKMGYSRSVYGRIIEQKEIGNKVIVFQAIYDKHQQADLFVKEYIVNDITFVSVLIKKMSFKENLCSVFDLKIREECVYGRKEIINIFNDYDCKYNPSKIYIESLWALPVSGEISNEKKVLVIHDIMRRFYLSEVLSNLSWLNKINSGLKYIKVIFREKKLINKYRVSSFIFLTAEDRDWYSKYIACNHADLASNKIDVNLIERNVERTKPFLLYPGSINFSQNYLAMMWLVRKILPKVNSDIKVVITGQAAIKKIHTIKKYDTKNQLTFTGEIEGNELEDLSRKCLAVISPIVTGSGIKIKILEAVQRGIPVVATKLSSRGINSELCFSAEDDSPEKYSHKLCEFLVKEKVIS